MHCSHGVLGRQAGQSRGLQISSPNPRSLGLLPGKLVLPHHLSSTISHSHIAGGSRMMLSWIYFFFFLPSKFALPRAAPPKLLRRRQQNRGARPCRCCASIAVISLPCQHKHRRSTQRRNYAPRGRTYSQAAPCAMDDGKPVGAPGFLIINQRAKAPWEDEARLGWAL